MSVRALARAGMRGARRLRHELPFGTFVGASGTDYQREGTGVGTSPEFGSEYYVQGVTMNVFT